MINIKINLSSQRYKIHLQKVLRVKYQLCISCRIGVVFSILGVVYVEHKIAKQTQRNELISLKHAELSQKASHLKTLKHSITLLSAQLSEFTQLLEKRDVGIKTFVEISAAVPESIFLTVINFTDSSIQLSGVAENANAVAVFIDNLKQSITLSSPVVKESTALDGGAFSLRRFDIRVERI
jgi:Tfp pilus assembly protein PilN